MRCRVGMIHKQRLSLELLWNQHWHDEQECAWGERRHHLCHPKVLEHHAITNSTNWLHSEPMQHEATAVRARNHRHVECARREAQHSCLGPTRCQVGTHDLLRNPSPCKNHCVYASRDKHPCMVGHTQSKVPSQEQWHQSKLREGSQHDCHLQDAPIAPVLEDLCTRDKTSHDSNKDSGSQS